MTCSHRDLIQQIVQDLPAGDLQEQADIRSTLDWIDSGAPLCRGAHADEPKRHLVVYCVVIDRNSGKILLVDHRKARLWLPPGGHVDVGENPLTTAKRECVEELGCELGVMGAGPYFLTVTETVGIVARHTDVTLWYLLQGDATTVFGYDEREFQSVRWFPLDSVPSTRTDPQMSRFLYKLKDNFFNASGRTEASVRCANSS